MFAGCSVLCYSAEFSDCSSSRRDINRVASICRLEPLQYCCRTCSGAAHCSGLLHTLHLGPRHKIHWADVTKISEFWPDRSSRGDGAECVLQCCSGCKLSSARLASQLPGLQSAAAAVVLQSRCSPALVLQTIHRRSCTITEKAPTRAFSWLKAATTTFTFKNLLRHYAKMTSR